MQKRVLGLVGGSGLYDLPGLENGRGVTVETPFGAPSDQLHQGTLAGVEVVFLARHGRGHRQTPSSINYRANIHALKQLGVTDLISISACGSLRAELTPGTFVLIDQFIDRTHARERSFFGPGLATHVGFAHPTCQHLNDALETTLRTLHIPHRRGGTALVIEGPQFSTLAESRLYRDWGCDVVGMTALPEARLAREAELPYANVAMVTDFDCWHPEHESVTVDQIVRVLHANIERARAMVSVVVPLLGATRVQAHHTIERALDAAIMTAPEARDAGLISKVMAVAGRALAHTAGAAPVRSGFDLESTIRTISDYPKPGIEFRDITTLLRDASAFKAAVDALAEPWLGEGITRVAAIEARGFIFGGAVAVKLGAGFVPIRKKGKLPHQVLRQAYQLEYGEDVIEMHRDAVGPGDRVLLIDDLIATGGTAMAAVSLIREAGAHVAGSAFVIDLPDIGGTATLRNHGIRVEALMSFSGQ